MLEKSSGKYGLPCQKYRNIKRYHLKEGQHSNEK